MLRAILLALALTLSAVPVAADTWDDAEAAYERGDYETALQLWPPGSFCSGGDFTLGDLLREHQAVPLALCRANSRAILTMICGRAWRHSDQAMSA